MPLVVNGKPLARVRVVLDTARHVEHPPDRVMRAVAALAFMVLAVGTPVAAQQPPAKPPAVGIVKWASSP